MTLKPKPRRRIKVRIPVPKPTKVMPAKKKELSRKACRGKVDETEGGTRSA